MQKRLNSKTKSENRMHVVADPCVRPNHDSIFESLDTLKIPFSGTTIYNSENKKYHVAPYTQISISGIGPVFYLNKKTQKIFTVLQRRFKDNFQWWFPGGYVELPPARSHETPPLAKIKEATIKEFYKNAIDYGCWQKAYKEINDPQELAKIFKKHKLKWPKEFDANWQSGWQREVLEESGIDLDKFKNKIILNFKCSKTLMIGAEPDRLINVDGKFCAFLGELNEAPEIKPDEDTEEIKWVALDEISFDKKKKNFFAFKKQVNIYTLALIEEALFEIICYKIKQISKIKNPITKQEISRFNTPQNLQSFLIANPIKSQLINKFLSWEFGDLEIGKNLCGKNGDRLYKTVLQVCELICKNNN